MRKTLLSVFVSIVLMGPLVANAGLKEALNEMFVSTSTDTQAFETQRLLGVYGGSMTIRPAGRAINIVQLAGPRIDAGCGGIDIFFGSFSFVNGEQFEQLVRALAANAVGFALKAGINTMCNPCGAIISELEMAIRELNALAKNTCAIASAMTNQADFDKLKERASNIGKRFSNIAQMTSDWAAAENKGTAVTTTEMVKDAKPESNESVGNPVYRAAKETMNNGANILSAFMSETEVIQMLHSLFGTLVVTPEGTANSTVTPSGASSRCGSDIPVQSCDVPGYILGPTIVKWDELFDTRNKKPTGLPVWKCANADCTELTSDKWSLATWAGTKDIVNIAMFGVVDISGGPTTYTNDSIVGSILHGGTSLSPQAQRLLKIMPAPVYRALLEIQKSKTGVDTVAVQFAETLPDHFNQVIGMELLSIANQAFSKQTKVMPPQEYSNNLREKSAELTQMRPKSIEMMKTNQTVLELVTILQKFMGSQIREKN